MQAMSISAELMGYSDSMSEATEKSSDDKQENTDNTDK